MPPRVGDGRRDPRRHRREGAAGRVALGGRARASAAPRCGSTSRTARRATRCSRPGNTSSAGSRSCRSTSKAAPPAGRPGAASPSSGRSSPSGPAPRGARRAIITSKRRAGATGTRIALDTVDDAAGPFTLRLDERRATSRSARSGRGPSPQPCRTSGRGCTRPCSSAAHRRTEERLDLLGARRPPRAGASCAQSPRTSACSATSPRRRAAPSSPSPRACLRARPGVRHETVPLDGCSCRWRSSSCSRDVAIRAPDPALTRGTRTGKNRAHDLHHHAPLPRLRRYRLRHRLPRRLHLRLQGQRPRDLPEPALHPPRRVHRLRGVRARVSRGRPFSRRPPSPPPFADDTPLNYKMMEHKDDFEVQPDREEGAPERRSRSEASKRKWDGRCRHAARGADRRTKSLAQPRTSIQAIAGAAAHSPGEVREGAQSRGVIAMSCGGRSASATGEATAASICSSAHFSSMRCGVDLLLPLRLRRVVDDHRSPGRALA